MGTDKIDQKMTLCDTAQTKVQNATFDEIKHFFATQKNKSLLLLVIQALNMKIKQ
jgi:hypothetical protein